MDRALTLPDLISMKQRGEKITCLTAYDAIFAHTLDRAGVDIVLVGDSLGMVIQGQENTLPVTMDDMVYHSRCAALGVRHAWLVTDLPFMSYCNPDQAAFNAARLMREGKARMVKLEGGRRYAETVRSLSAQGIPVCAHLGLTPQSIHRLGGFRIQGKEREAAKQILGDAQILEEAGASLLVLECIPHELASKITKSIQIPTIGIGAGNGCDGQVLVLHDLLGLSFQRSPKFAKDFLADHNGITAAVKAFIQAVRKGEFPGPEHAFE